MAWLALLRHGATEWNARGLIQGRTDVPLCAAGIARLQQIRPGGDFLRAQWTSSPLARARQTAAILNPLATVETEPRLIETDWGDFGGVPRGELKSRIRELGLSPARGLDFTPPRGESPRQVRARLLDWLQISAAAAGGRVAVTHKGVLRAAISLACGWDMQTDMNAFLRAHNWFAPAAGDPRPAKLDWELPHIFKPRRAGDRPFQLQCIRLNCPWDARPAALAGGNSCPRR